MKYDRKKFEMKNKIHKNKKKKLGNENIETGLKLLGSLALF
jgi:hypothetical protein